MAPPVRLLAPLIALVLAGSLSGCSGGRTEPPPAPADTSASEIRAGLAELWVGDNPTNEDAAAASCFAKEFLSRTGDERLRETGIIDSGGAVVTSLPVLDNDLAGDWVDAQFECVDYVEEATRALAAQSHGAADEKIFATCLEQSMSPEEIRAALVAGLAGVPEAPELDVLTQAYSECAQAAA